MQTSEYNGLFGLRLSPSVHLGHLVGNIRPAIEDKDSRKVIVVLADLFTYTSSRRNDITQKNALSMTAECLALGLDSKNVFYVIQSKAFNNILPLFTILSCLLKYEKLKKAKPLSRMFLDTQNLTFAELTFPIIQCAEMVSTKSEILYSNVDNLGIISLTKDLYRKLGSYTGAVLPKPKLTSGEFPHVKGTDHLKMSQSTSNAIFIEDDSSSLKKKIISIDTSRNPEKEIDLSLIFDYCKIIGYTKSEIAQLDEDFKSKKISALEIKKNLVSELDMYTSAIRKLKKEILKDELQLINRINENTAQMNFEIQKNVETIFRNFYHSEFSSTFNI